MRTNSNSTPGSTLPISSPFFTCGNDYLLCYQNNSTQLDIDSTDSLIPMYQNNSRQSEATLSKHNSIEKISIKNKKSIDYGRSNIKTVKQGKSVSAR